jgi:hypothetical protein
MQTIYYGRTAWKNLRLDVESARQWFNLMGVGEVEVEKMLLGIATNQYSMISKEIDLFLKVLALSKHGRNPQLISDFISRLNSDVLKNCNPASQSKEILEFLMRNEEWKSRPLLKLKLQLACDKFGLSLFKD